MEKFFKLKQICWDSKRKDDLHAMIVKMKILNQIEILKVNNKDFECGINIK